MSWFSKKVQIRLPKPRMENKLARSVLAAKGALRKTKATVAYFPIQSTWETKQKISDRKFWISHRNVRHFCLHVRDVRATCASIWRISRRCMHNLDSNLRFWLHSKISNICLIFFGRSLLIFLHFGGKYKLKKNSVFPKTLCSGNSLKIIHRDTESTQTFFVDVGKHLKFPER